MTNYEQALLRRQQKIRERSNYLPEYTPDVPESRLNPLKPELINGVLRKGHKMLISGDSKMGKSFMLIELGIALATGSEWMGFRCRQSSVLYINLEIDEDSFAHRVAAVKRARGVHSQVQFFTWNLRGENLSLRDLKDILILRMDEGQCPIDVVIIDPIYKLIEGDENNATDIARFCRNLDEIAEEMRVSVICCHHHSKGHQGAKRTIDRASGSGVFARDTDALIDITEIEQSEAVKTRAPVPGASAWRMEFTLREFADPDPVNIWFCYPIHIIDSDVLTDSPLCGTSAAARAKNRKTTTAADRKIKFENAFEKLAEAKKNEPVDVNELAKELKLTPKTVRSRIQEFSDEFKLTNGLVFKKADSEAA